MRGLQILSPALYHDGGFTLNSLGFHLTNHNLTQPMLCRKVNLMRNPRIPRWSLDSLVTHSATILDVGPFQRSDGAFNATMSLVQMIQRSTTYKKSLWFRHGILKVKGYLVLRVLGTHEDTSNKGNSADVLPLSYYFSS